MKQVSQFEHIDSLPVCLCGSVAVRLGAAQASLSCRAEEKARDTFVKKKTESIEYSSILCVRVISVNVDFYIAGI